MELSDRIATYGDCTIDLHWECINHETDYREITWYLTAYDNYFHCICTSEEQTNQFPTKAFDIMKLIKALGDRALLPKLRQEFPNTMDTPRHWRWLYENFNI